MNGHLVGVEDDDKVYDVIVIGAGFCGIACGAGLKTFGFVILEKGDCCGYFWKSCTYDRLHLHTPYHDLPYDKGLVWGYSKYKSKDEVVSYLNAYSDLYRLAPNIKFNATVTNIGKRNHHHNASSSPLWCITYTSQRNMEQQIKAKYLVVATSPFRLPSIPKRLQESMNQFNGDIMHSIEYKNASKYAGQNMLIIGNGNSACEIAIDAAEHGVDKITLVSRRARHFVPLQTYDQGIFKQMVYGKYLGQFDKMHEQFLMKLTKKNPKWRTFVDRGKADADAMSVDLSNYGIIKPKLSNTEETAEGNYEVIDIGFIPLLKQGRVSVINKGGVKHFDGENVVMENGETLAEKYHVVVLCTGFEHGLEKLFDDDIFHEYFYDGVKEKCELYQRYQIFPKTNGFNQAQNDKSLYFAGFDMPITGGLARGLWGWQIARTISKQEGKYDESMELSHWNYMNTLVYVGIVSVAVVGIAGMGGLSWYFWKHRQHYFPYFRARM